MTDEISARLRLLESKVLSDLDVRVALLEKAVAVSGEDKAKGDLQARENNVPTRISLIEERARGLNRLMWIILTAILAANIQLFLIHWGGK